MQWIRHIPLYKRTKHVTYQTKTILEILRCMQPQYLIKYKGYPDSENTWEPPENLSCPKMIRRFERQLSGRKSSIGLKAPVQAFYEYDSITDKRSINGIVSGNAIASSMESRNRCRLIMRANWLIFDMVFCTNSCACQSIDVEIWSCLHCNFAMKCHFRWNIWLNGRTPRI